MTVSISARLSLFALAGLASGATSAQVKTDGEWRGVGGAALAMTSGNSTSSAVSINAEMVRATTDDKMTLGASANYARSKSAGVTSTTANKWSAAGQYDTNLSQRVFAFGKLGLEGDEIINLTLRSTLAAGLGYKVIDSAEASLNVFGGAAHSSDRYDAPKVIGGKTGERFSRTSALLGEESSHKLSSSTTFKQRLDLYPGATGDKAVLAKFTSSLAVAVSSTLNLTVGLVDNYNSKPPSGTKRNDIGLFTGVNVKFGAP